MPNQINTTPHPVPGTPNIIAPSPTSSESSEKLQESYFPPTTRSRARKQKYKSPQAESIREERDASGSDSSTEKRARPRSRSPGPSSINGAASRETNGDIALPQQANGYLSPYARVQKSWRDFSRSPSPLGLIPLHRHHRNFIHKHEIPRKLLHVSIGFFTLKFYTGGLQANAITPWLMGALIPIASVDVLRHRWDACNRLYVRLLGALMRETEVDGYNGVIWYLLGAYIALQFYPKDIATMSILLLSWCDTAASTFGRLYGRYTIRLRKGKSLAGTLAAFITGMCTSIFFWGWLAPRTGTFPDDPPGGFMFQGHLTLPSRVQQMLGFRPSEASITGTFALLVMSICVGIIASISEFIDILGWDDNLTIPLLSSAGLWVFLRVFGS